MLVSCVTRPPMPVMTASFTLHYHLSMETTGCLDHFALSDENSTSCEAAHNTSLSEALQAKHDNVYNLVVAVHNKPLKNQESQFDKHVRKKQNSFTQL